MQKYLNQFDIALFLLIFSVSTGRYGIVTPITAVVLLFSPLFFENWNRLLTKKYKIFPAVLFFWLLYGFISLYWAPSTHDAYLGLFLMFINSLMFLEILVFSQKSKNPLLVVSTAWVIAFLFTSIIAINEIITGQHLASAREERDLRNAMGETFEKQYASVNFYNPNTYCYYICFAFPFALYLLSIHRGLKMLLLGALPTLLAVVIMFLNSSRGGLLTLSIMLLVFFFYLMNDRLSKKKLSIFIVVLFGVVIVINFGDILFSAIQFRLSEKGLLEDNARLMLWASSWSSFLDTNGIGVGVGNMQYALEQERGNMLRIYYSHNMLLEILLEYGIIFATIPLLFLYKLFEGARSISDKTRKVVLYGSLLSFPFYSVINSENLKPSFIWCFFASLYIFSSYRSLRVHL